MSATMTAHRFNEIKAGAQPATPEEEKKFQELLRWERRSNAAKRAVQTKKQRYKTWPTRKGDHK